MIYSDISGGESLEIHARNLLKIETIFGAVGGGDAPPYPCLQTCIIILFKLGFFIYHKINSHSWTSIRSISVAPPPPPTPTSFCSCGTLLDHALSISVAPNTHLFLFLDLSFRSCTFNFSCTAFRLCTCSFSCSSLPPHSSLFTFLGLY